MEVIKFLFEKDGRAQGETFWLRLAMVLFAMFACFVLLPLMPLYERIKLYKWLYSVRWVL